jgi:hypothetical protein
MILITNPQVIEFKQSTNKISINRLQIIENFETKKNVYLTRIKPNHSYEYS